MPEVRREHFSSLAPHPLVALLRCVKSESGYRHVYPAHPERARTLWFVKVRVRGRLVRLSGSACRLPHQAALHAVLWYGFAVRQTEAPPPDRHPPHVPWTVWQLRKRDGYAARVWEFGRPVEVTGSCARNGAAFDTLARCRLRSRGQKKPGRLLVFATEEEARAAVRRFIELRWGADAGRSVWRS